jgi:hypothetical protein
MTLKRQHGQVTAEMAVLFTFVIAGIVFMGTYLQRAAQGGIKGNADSLGSQFSTSETQGGYTSYSEQQSTSRVSGVTGSASCSRSWAQLDGAAPAPLTNCDATSPRPTVVFGNDPTL